MTTGAMSLLTAIHSQGHVHLILGTNPLAATRCGQSLTAGASPIVIAPESSEVHYILRKRIDAGEVKWVRRNFEAQDIFSLGREEVGNVVDAVFVTSGQQSPENTKLSTLCQRNRIPINVIDSPSLCTFSLLSTHNDGPLQIGVTTNGRGCKLASRIRREIASSLPANLGTACALLGEVRRRIHEEDRLAHQDSSSPSDPSSYDADDTIDQSASFNQLVLPSDHSAAKTRRIRWLSQVCEYWPLNRLASIQEADMDTLLESYHQASDTASTSHLSPPPPTSSLGKIILAGSGPGHPSLLTLATHSALRTADLVLADKLVPSAILSLIPRRTRVHIARKFPGNADAAQEELESLALSAYRSGQTVLRLKQGDPYVYGRGGEEVRSFLSRAVPAHRVVVLPGLTSALSGPVFAGIPATMRDVADQVLICTGTGKKGAPPRPPGYSPSRTAVFLMALHRIGGLVAELTARLPSESGAGGEGGGRALWPPSTPCAVVERASCPDQRVIRTSLAHVAEAVESEGSRPPGLLVVGRACEALAPDGTPGKPWVVEEGFRGGLDEGLLSPPVSEGLDLAGAEMAERGGKTAMAT